MKKKRNINIKDVNFHTVKQNGERKGKDLAMTFTKLNSLLNNIHRQIKHFETWKIKCIE